MIALSLIIFAVNALRSVRKGEVAGQDPWDGGTLEWTIPSPPPVYNYGVIPVVNSRYPAWDTKRGSGHIGAETPPSEPDPDAHHSIHMPNPSYWPILLAAGLVLTACGLIFHQVFILLGAMIFGVSLFGWIEEPAA
jgi:cytochrome c oxidase subunit 1